jgi:hypothetical protein
MVRVAKRVALVAEIVLAYVRAKLLMRRSDLPAVLTALRKRGPAAPDREKPAVAAGERLGGIVARTLDTLPTDSRCLIRSLVLTSLLDRRGVASTLVIGVSPGEDFGAHAWLEVAGRPVQDAGGTDFPRLVEL